MQYFRKGLFYLFLLMTTLCRAQSKDAIRKYIDAYKDVAIAEMQRTGVPAAITLAQGIHESGAGLSQLVIASNNHFGIKCKSNWTGETVKHDDDAKGECFRKYPSPADSYKDHSDFLKSSQRYAFLFDLDPTDYVGWANGLKKAGYATNPKYPQVLIKMIEDYGLQDYTFIAMGKMPVKNDSDISSAVATTEEATETITDQPAVQPAGLKTQAAIAAISYPAGQFSINETRVVFVKKGTSYFAIAKQYDIDLSKIFEFNEMPKAEAAEKDQPIFLQRKRKTGVDEFHIVQPGESLHDIAQQQGIRMESLRELNWLKERDNPAAGEKLSLKTKSATVPKLALKENYSIIQQGRPSTN
jgi:LysM repeat protein